MRNEFLAWLQEVKKLPIEGLDKRAEAELFTDFVEDFNTATMPDKKFYDLDRWEKKMQARQQMKNIKKAVAMAGITDFNDEKTRAADLAKQREAAKEKNVQ